MNRPILTAALLAFAAPALAAPPVLTPAAQAVKLRDTPRSAALVQEVNDRLVRSMSASSTKTTIIYGALPADFPLKLPAPLRVLASIRTTYGPSLLQMNDRFLVSSDSDLKAARAELKQQLLAQGWQPQQTNEPIGFLSDSQPSYNAYFREGKAGTPHYSLTANIAQGPSGNTELDISANPITAESLASLKKSQLRPQSSLPTLQPLPGATIRSNYNSVGANGTMASAYIQTTLGAAEVFNFYSAQLKAAGWKAANESASGPLRAVTYTLSDLNGREAVGMLAIRPWEKGGYVLSASVFGFKPQ